jgi:opacity protein-like surface antigen
MDNQSAGLILTRDARLGVSYTPADRLSFTASGSIAQTEFLQPEIAAGQGLVAHTAPGSSPETTTYTFDLGLSFRLSQRVAGRIAYAYRTRFVTVSSGGSTSSSNSENFDVNTLTAGLTMTYD